MSDLPSCEGCWRPASVLSYYTWRSTGPAPELRSGVLDPHALFPAERVAHRWCGRDACADRIVALARERTP